MGSEKCAHNWYMYSPGGTIKYMWVVCCGRVLKLFALQVFDMLDGSKFIFFLKYMYVCHTFILILILILKNSLLECTIFLKVFFSHLDFSFVIIGLTV
jgi:hypothetical protein